MLILSNHVHDIVTQIKEHVKENCALIAIGENIKIEIPELIDALNKANISFIGGIFPKVIAQSNTYEKGIVVTPLYNVKKIFTIQEISKKSFTIPNIAFNSDKEYSLITYVDGLTAHISNYLSKLYENYGMKTNYFGGGAGSLSLVQQPCVFSKDGFFEDAAIACILEMKSSIGVKHGWKKLNGPFIVNKANTNTVEEINWENPFTIYKDIVEKDALQTFNDSNFFDIAKGYPLGIIKQGLDSVIRDPLTVNANNELVCVGEVEENTLINIMKGDACSLINAAVEATEESISKAQNPKTAFVIDCISRVLYLENDFEKEIQNVSKTIQNKFPDIDINGALTLGEISSYGNGFIEFYNKTIVVSLFE
ncbi:conserved hypothetical protein [Tenacibaculum sp. 190524A02b]|uniref:Histidine kinase n=1 Tax=Tenacibaculum vairaonense TaxID=3137860 RepID=A0ABP1FBC5_9FLAO